MKRLIPALFALLLLAGCSPILPYRDVEQLQLVQTMGFDTLPGGYLVSVSTGRAPEGESAELLSASGASIDSAVRKLQDWSAREELYFAHVRYAAVGEDAAREGIDAVLDYFLRSTQIRLDLPLFVIQDGTAREAVTGSADTTFEITAALSSLQRDAERTGTAHCFTLLDIALGLERSGAALCCAVRSEEANANVPSAEDGSRAALEMGYGILKDGRLTGWLDRSGARGANLLLGYAGGAIYILSDGQGGTITVELRSGSTDIVPEWDGAGALTLVLKPTYTAGIAEADGDPFSGDALRLLNDELSRAIAADLRTALEKSQTLDADFLQLYRTLERKAPDKFPKTPSAGFLPALCWRIEAAGTIERSYDIDAPAETSRR